MKEVDRFGIRKVTQMALEHITPGNKRPLHVSFDIDSLDDREVITTGTPGNKDAETLKSLICMKNTVNSTSPVAFVFVVPGGLTLREGLTLMEEINEAGNLVSMDFVEVNHLLGNALDRKRTVNVVKQLLVTAFGYYRGGISASPNVPIANTS
jgi:arginase